ncbi:MAG: hypothetical protein MnENMB40S_21690 [Rhizobiaceae bacterium MnEN-MB40S]|nr:MAG: hypothetical protein MnENMB40S_21690 [Rhizobiaceae bacterium MnEN-MB40S]
MSAAAVLAGQIYESQALLRLSLEHGAYGSFIGNDVQRAVRWLKRTESESSRKAVRKEFTHRNIVNHLQTIAPVLAKQYENLYEGLIDFGAHPNESGFSLNTIFEENNGNTFIRTVYLQDDGLPLNLALKTTVQVGMWVLHIMQLIYVQRFQLLGIKDALEELRERY